MVDDGWYADPDYISHGLAHDTAADDYTHDVAHGLAHDTAADDCTDDVAHGGEGGDDDGARHEEEEEEMTSTE